jgi:nucleotide-binding universal stress UspA family protein
MYKKIYIPVDNSEHSNAAMDLAVALGRAFGSELVGSHVIAGGLHAHRFRQMEGSLPEKYQDEAALEQQRRNHAALMARGLQLIAGSYLDVLAAKARQAGLPFTRKLLDGKNYVELVRDICGTEPDLVILGALGLGAVKESTLGSVCERVVRRVRTDTLVVKCTLPMQERDDAPILVGVDGSPQSYGGLRAALALGRTFGTPVEAVAVYDPTLHGIIFHRLVGVLSEQAARLFRSEEQEQLHEEVIDTGLAKIYRSYLEVARKVAAGQGIDLKVSLLSGKPFEAIIRHVRKVKPWLLVLGRVGFHGDEELDIGSTSENLQRLAPCHVLLSSQAFFSKGIVL